jgi:hypothetical protein
MLHVKSPESAPEILCWRGTMPPQKWMHCYTKILSKFVSSPGLTLQVGSEVPVDREGGKRNVEKENLDSDRGEPAQILGVTPSHRVAVPQ